MPPEMPVDKGLQKASGHPSGMPCLRGFAGSAALPHLTTLFAVLLVLLAFGFLQGLARLVQFRLTLLVFQEVAFPFIVDLRNAHA